MILKTNRQKSIAKYPKLPLREYNYKKEDYDFFYPETFTGYVLTVPSKSFRGHVKLLAAFLTDLITHLGYDKLIFLGDTAIPWLHRDHSFKQAKEALLYLSNNKVGKRFNGALHVGRTELPIFTKHLAWLVSSNAILPYVNFLDPNQNIMGAICQYGNLHIYTLDKKVDKHLKEAIGKTGFQYLVDRTC